MGNLNVNYVWCCAKDIHRNMKGVLVWLKQKQDEDLLYTCYFVHYYDM